MSETAPIPCIGPRLHREVGTCSVSSRCTRKHPALRIVDESLSCYASGSAISGALSILQCLIAQHIYVGKMPGYACLNSIGMEN